MTFIHKHRVRFSETDMAGIVHFASYFTIIEEAEQLFFADVLGYSYSRMFKENLGLPRVHVDCDYKSPMRVDDIVTIELTVAKAGLSSLTLAYALYIESDQDKRLVANASTVLVFIQNGESVDIPEAIREKLDAL